MSLICRQSINDAWINRGKDQPFLRAIICLPLGQERGSGIFRRI